jgi:hypothetical protein
MGRSEDQISVVEAAIVPVFEVIFDQKKILRRMVGLDMVIQLRDDAVLFYVNEECPISSIDRVKLKSLLDNLVVIKSIVPFSKALEWTASLVVIRNAKSEKL